MSFGERAMRQAHMTARNWMINARIDIDEQFGKGFAAKNPTLVSGYMITAGLDQLVAVILETQSEF